MLVLISVLLPSISLGQTKNNTLERKRISQILFKLGNNITAIEKYIDRGASLTERDPGGYTILHQAVQLKSLELVEFLLDRKADINAKVIPPKSSSSQRGYTPLMLAVNNRDYEIVNVLLSNGANVNIKGENGKTALAIAEAYGSDDMLSEWLRDVGGTY